MMPVWLFSSGPLGTPTHPIPSGEPADVRVLSRLTRASAHRTFPGRLEMKRLDFAERASGLGERRLGASLLAESAASA